MDESICAFLSKSLESFIIEVVFNVMTEINCRRMMIVGCEACGIARSGNVIPRRSGY